MSFESFDVVYYTSLFILAGFIIEEIVASFVPTRTHSDWVKAVRCFLYSIINCAASSWAYILITERYTDDNPTYWLLGLAATLLVSFCLGIIISLLKKFNLFRMFFGLFKIQLTHPVPTAWDYKFSNLSGRYVIIDLNNGSTIYGYYSSHSFASSIPEERDIYLENVYTYKNGKPWTPVIRNDGILIKWNEIQSITFYHEYEIENRKDEEHGEETRKRRLFNKRIPTKSKTG